MTQSILITGAAGFIGQAVAAELARRADVELLLTDNLSRGREDEAFHALCERPNVRFLSCDLCEPSEVREKLVGNFNTIYHFAARIGVKNVRERPDEVLRVNLQSTLNLYEHARQMSGLQRLLFASTSEVYAGTLRHYDMEVPTPETTPLTIDDVQSPRTSYALSKICGESIVFNAATVHDVPSTVVRYHNVYGPRMGFMHVVPELIDKFSRQERVSIASPGHTRAFCYIDDAVRATILSAESPQTKNLILNIGNPEEEKPILELARTIADACGFQGELVGGEDTPGSPARRCPDISRLRETTGFSPEVGLTEGIRRTHAWYAPRLAERYE